MRGRRGVRCFDGQPWCEDGRTGVSRARAVAEATRLAKGRAKGKHPRRRALLPPPFPPGHAGQLKDGDMSRSAGMGMTDKQKQAGGCQGPSPLHCIREP